jgi:polyisoprenyl-phosphate glycosyltransferase
MSSQKTYAISVIVPFLNEEGNIARLMQELEQYLAGFHANNVEVLFVDDGSSDQSVAIIRGKTFASFDARIIQLSRNFGSHSALRAGVFHARGEYITFVYADLQDPLALIGQMYERGAGGIDIVYASRRSIQGSLPSKLFSRLYASLMRLFVHRSYPNNGIDIVMFNQKVKRELDQNIEPNSSVFLQLLAMGFRYSFIQYDKQRRAYGKSKWTLSKKIKIVIDSFVAFSYAPIRLVSIMGIVLSSAGFLWLIYIVMRALLSGDLIQGWPMLMAILVMGFGATNLSLGILAEYLWRTLDAVRNRKVFIVDTIIDLPKETP